MPTTTTGEETDAEYIGSWFTIELDNGVEGNFREVSGLNIEIEVVDVTDTNGDTVSRKRPGTTRYSDIVLKRALSSDKTFWDWAKSIRDGDKEFRTNGAIVLHDITGEETGRWTFENAWPSRWSASDLDVGSDDVMEEEVTLAVELLARDK